MAAVSTAPTPVVSAGSPHATAAAAVTHQVIPEVTRLATAGNGTHRITLTLNPDHLGEVKISMVVRDGAVRVSLSAGDNRAVQQALSGGAPELHRLLEQVGATDTRIVVQPAASQGQQTQTQGQTQGQGQPTLTGESSTSRQGADPSGQRSPDGHRPHRDPEPTLPTRATTRRTAEPGRLDRSL